MLYLNPLLQVPHYIRCRDLTGGLCVCRQDIFQRRVQSGERGVAGVIGDVLLRELDRGDDCPLPGLPCRLRRVDSVENPQDERSRDGDSRR